MFVVQPWSRDSGDEELTSVGTRTSVCHTESVRSARG